MTFWSAWEGDARDTLVGVGALKRLTAHKGEVKSMHTAEAMRGRGGGAALLAHIVACPPFGDYRPDPHSVFLTLALRSG